MNFMLTKEQENFKMEVKELTEKYVTPFAAENDKYSSFPKKSIEILSQNGIMGIPFEKKYGGLGLDNLTYITGRTFKRLCFNRSNNVCTYFSLFLAYFRIWN